MRTHWLAVLVLALPACSSHEHKGEALAEGEFLVQADFEATNVSGLPAGWRIGETNGKGLPASWGPTKGRSGKAFGVLETRNVSQTFNMALLEGVELKDFEASLAVHAVSGTEDRGGGLVWRAKGFDDYYITRWNPLEDNLRLYKVVGGYRTQLASARLRVDPDAWHVIRVSVMGPRVRVWFDGEAAIDHEDATFTEAGRLGLWTKADAATVFDELRVR
ncbi:MAG: hypothetical protein R3F30_13815 [Planctomycetota bacterium]